MSYSLIYISKNDINHFTECETPKQNDIAEMMNRTLLEKVQCMLSNFGLSNVFWAESLMWFIW